MNFKSFALGAFAAAGFITLGASVFLILGGMPVATTGAPLPFERFLAKTALHAAMRGQVEKPSPLEISEANLLMGAKIYKIQCAVCHGLLSGQPTAIARGLFPKPPQLFQPGHSVSDDPVGESYWKIKNGIRLTGMPGFVDSLSERELWQVSQLVNYADQLPPRVLGELGRIEK